MTYGTAQKLKNAGFPHITKWEVENNYRRISMVLGESLPPLGALLSELPQEENFGLIKNDEHLSNDWTCFIGSTLGTWKQSTHGDTPEEAVANLWLTLHP